MVPCVGPADDYAVDLVVGEVANVWTSWIIFRERVVVLVVLAILGIDNSLKNPFWRNIKFAGKVIAVSLDG